MDDGTLFRRTPQGPELIDIPAQQITGELHVEVPLIYFYDLEGYLPLQHYEDLLFSENVYPTGSMKDYYREVSPGNVDATVSVHGWIRMPESYSFYTNKESGLNWHSYTRKPRPSYVNDFGLRNDDIGAVNSYSWDINLEISR